MNALSHVFYKALFYHTLYGEDLREEIRMLVDKEECLMFKKQIEGDKNALAILSTIAVTYLYYLEYLFPEEGKVHPEVLLACAKEAYVGALKEKYLLQGYLLTHAIIGASYFYAKPIREHRSIYEEMWKETELLLIAHYGQLSLDLKCEFLVCTRMLEKETPLWKLIQEEAKRSYSPMGNFLVDKENTYKENYKKASLRTAEHRNVLYTMAFGTTPIFLEQPWL
jgi:hypothetical protein